MQHIGSRIRSLMVLFVAALFISGCQTTLTVHNAAKKDVTQMLKDYVGMHGYNLTYQNDATGSYHVDMGTVYVSGNASTTKSKTIVAQPASSSTGQPLTAYEETSWNSVNNPARNVPASAAVSITQKDSDVVVFIDTNDAAGTSLNDIKDYIQSFGYKID